MPVGKNRVLSNHCLVTISYNALSRQKLKRGQIKLKQTKVILLWQPLQIQVEGLDPNLEKAERQYPL